MENLGELGLEDGPVVGRLVGGNGHGIGESRILYASNPSIKNFRKCRWVMPLSSLRVTSGVIE